MISASQPPPDEPRARILGSARTHLLAYGYSGFTMDDIARELGMSKKTLYRHFPGKDDIITAIIDDLSAGLRARLDAILADTKRDFTAKVRGVAGVIGDTIGPISPAVFRDLQRFAPSVYDQVENVRMKMIPHVFGGLIRMGIAEGAVRSDIDPAFVTEFWLQAVRGLVQPAVLERTQRTIRQTLGEALFLFFNGLLTPAGRKSYEKNNARLESHASR